MNFTKSSLNTLGTAIINNIAMIGVSVYVARMLGPQAKGTYSLLIQFASIVTLFGMFGINNSIVYFLGKGERLDNIYQNILSLSFVAGLAIVAVFAIFMKYIQMYVFKDISLILIATIFFSIPFMLANKYSLTTILGLNRIKAFNNMKILSVFILILSLLFFLLAFSMQIQGLVAGYVASEMIMFGIFIPFFYRKCKIKFSFDKGLLKKMTKYGIRGFFAPLFLLLIQRIDFFLLNYFYNAKSVGFYSIAVAVSEMSYLIPVAFGTVLFPRLSSSDRSEINRKTVQLIRASFFVLLVAVGCLYFFGNQFILLVYGRQYYPSIIIYKYLLPGFFMMSFYYIFFSYFSLINKQGVITIIIFFNLIAKALLSFKMIPLWGIEGAAIASTISYSLCGIMIFALFMKYSGVRLTGIICLKISDIRYVLRSLDIYREVNSKNALPLAYENDK